MPRLVQLVGNAHINIRQVRNRIESQMRDRAREAERVRNMEEALSLILKSDVIPLPYRQMAMKALGKDPIV